MHFDDRLATVLRHRAQGERAARTQYRQLLDLLGERRTDGDRRLLTAAWLRLGALGEAIAPGERAAIVREQGHRCRNPELAAHLAEDEPAVAAAALGTARLSEEDWTALIPHLPVRARGFLRLRRDLPERVVTLLDRLGVSDRALPLPQVDEPLVLTELADEDEDAAEGPLQAGPVVTPFPANDAADPATPRETAATTPAPAAPPEPNPISALVERIEAFKRNRSEAGQKTAREGGDDQTPLPFVELQEPARAGEDEGLVFTTDGGGRIDWAEERYAAMLRYLALADTMASLDALRIEARQPLTAVRVDLEGAPAIAGRWYCDAVPRFDPVGGRFLGYAGRLRRAAEDERHERDEAGDRMRQLLHELRTPVNAIQGFAEVIQQQLFGPVPHEYRALAASIAGDSARMLAGFDELDRLAKLESGLRELDTGEADLSAIVTGQLAQLASILQPREAGFKVRIAPDCRIGLAPGEAEVLSWRLLAVLAGATAPGESLRIRLDRDEASGDGHAVLDCELPESLANCDDVFAAASRKQGGGAMLTPGSFGSGFALRLARAEARSIGGQLAREQDRLILTLPLLTASQATDSAGQEATQDTARPGVS